MCRLFWLTWMNVRLNTQVSQGSVTTDFRRGGWFYCSLFSSSQSARVKGLLKLVHNCQSYHEKLRGCLFLTRDVSFWLALYIVASWFSAKSFKMWNAKFYKLSLFYFFAVCMLYFTVFVMCFLFMLSLHLSYSHFCIILASADCG